MVETIKLTNSQGQEGEYEEIDEFSYAELSNYMKIESLGYIRYYKKLPPKEVYPKIFENQFYKIEIFISGNISINAKDSHEFWGFRKESISLLKQALAEAEKIQNQGKSENSLPETFEQKSPDNNQDKSHLETPNKKQNYPDNITVRKNNDR